MSEAATSPDVLEGVFAVDEGDDVHLAVHDYEWSNPYEVTDVDHVDWEGATGEVWATREVLVEGGYDSTFQVTAIEGDADLELRKYPGGQKRGDLERFEPVDEEEKGESGTSTEDSPTSDIDSESEAETDVLEEDAADDAPGPSTEYLETVNEVLDGDDVQEEIISEGISVDAVDGEGEDDSDEIECEGCGQTFESQQALQGHGPNSCEGGDDESVALPDGVTEDDVDELTSGGIEIGDLAEELDVHRNEARLIAHQLGFYKRVREVWRDRERAQLDPRLGGLLVVALGLVMVGLIAVGVTAP
ncbi:hypothetical protein [Natrinema thermotolerans]